MQPHSTRRGDRHDLQLRSPVKPAVEDEQASVIGRRIVCASCGHPITTEQQRIEVNGSHEHRCVNPHGLVFHIGCFHGAPGCITHGAPTTEFTWFSGFAWNYALCAGCSVLLGWQYHGTDAVTFFGLILNRLASEQPH